MTEKPLGCTRMRTEYMLPVSRKDSDINSAICTTILARHNIQARRCNVTELLGLRRQKSLHCARMFQCGAYVLATLRLTDYKMQLIWDFRGHSRNKVASSWHQHSYNMHENGINTASTRHCSKDDAFTQAKKQARIDALQQTWYWANWTHKYVGNLCQTKEGPLRTAERLEVGSSYNGLNTIPKF